MMSGSVYRATLKARRPPNRRDQRTLPELGPPSGKR